MSFDPDEIYAKVDAIFINHPKFAHAYGEVRDLVELPVTLT